MASTSDFGIACVLPMVALAASSLGVAAPAPAQSPAPVPSDLSIEIVGLRDAKGVVQLCLVRDSADFPKCKGRTATNGVVRASTGPIRYIFHGVAAGTYAIAAFHDANHDGKLNTTFGAPTEGFAFSRNPGIKLRAPRFNEASFDSNDRSLPPLKMKYLF